MTESPLPPASPGPTELSSEDDSYVRSRFVTLAHLAMKCGLTEAQISTWQKRSLFPSPTYVTSDGEGWYSSTLVSIVRRAVTRGSDLRTLFFKEFLEAARRLPRTDPITYQKLLDDSSLGVRTDQALAEEHWKGFLGGGFGACLKVPWVPCMIRKVRLIRRIETLTGRPAPDDRLWARRLKESVGALDQLEMPFAQWDRIRFGGPVTRDKYITSVRQRFPEVFDGVPEVGRQVSSADSARARV